MKQTLKILLLLSIAVLLAGCKLAVIVVEGGEVQSTGSGTCLASAICIVDVDDTNFAETFTAVPDLGWYFQKWNSGDGFFCGGSILPTCTLYFRGHEAEEWVGDMVASSEMFYLMPVFKQALDIITVDGKQWYQPSFFRGLSWEDINRVCPAGQCTGVLNGYDMTGWTWASVDDFNALVNYYIGSDQLGPGLDSYEAPASAGVAFFSDGWLTGADWFSSRINGLVRPDDVEGRSYNFSSPWNYGRLIYVEKENGFVEVGTSVSVTTNSVSGGGDRPGAWFHRRA
jgi:hypothetical protein